MGKASRIYVADFETTTDPEDCRVWAWGMVDIEKAKSGWHVAIDKTIDSFFDYVQSLGSVVCYFHNLRFDGSFIIDTLFRMGYRHVQDNPRRGEFTTLISSMGQFYSMTVAWRKGARTEFRDSAKKLPMQVSEIAKAFELFEAKGEIDYKAYRKPGHEITREERTYIINDVLIVAKAIKQQLDSGMDKLTVGADALAEYKFLTGKAFQTLFPILSDTMDAEIRQAYRGGFTYVDPRFQGRITGKGKTFDVNSLYPSVMYDRLLPYGEPVWSEGLPRATKTHPLFIVSLTFTAKLKKNHIPCIQVKGSRFNEVEYLRLIDEPVTIACTNVDLDLWNDQYDIDVLSYNGGWLFQGITGVFDQYIDKWMEVKANNTGGLRTLAKLQLNSLYGKFATNPDVTPNIPHLDRETDTVKYTLGAEERRNPIYTAMGVFITSYARETTIRAAQDHYKVFAYADTDSLHLITEEVPAKLDIHPSRLGAWKHEYDFDAAFFARPKAYAEFRSDKQKYEVHISGMPKKIANDLTFEDFTNGRKFSGNLKQKRVPGGVVLIDQEFTLKF